MKVTVLNLPSPPYLEVTREWAGGFGTAQPCPDRKDYGQSYNPVFQPFMAYACGVLSDVKCEYSVVDCQRLKLNQTQVLKAITNENPDIIFSVISLPSLKRDLGLLDKIGVSLQNSKIIVAGTVCQVLTTEVLSTSNVQIVSRARYPYVQNLEKLIQTLSKEEDLKGVPNISYKQGKEIVNTDFSFAQNRQEIGQPLYDSLELDGYGSFSDVTGEEHPYISIVGSIGCPYPCIYCPYPVGFGCTRAQRFPKRIVDEIEYLHLERGISGFLFRDQSFSMDKKYAQNICNDVIQRKLDVRWHCEVRVNEITRDMLDLMRKAGCKRVHYGVETGDEKLLKIAKPGVNLSTIKKAFEITKHIGLWRSAHTILGWPDETLETLLRTSKFILRLDPDEINLNFLTPYPGTKLYAAALKNSWLLTTDWSQYTSNTIVIKPKNLNVLQLYEAKTELIRNFRKHKLGRLFLNLPRSKRKSADLTKILGEIRIYLESL